MSGNEGVSFVICCYNSSSRIKTTLEHLQKIEANGIPWEVVLVDNNSDDDTTAKALSIWNIDPVVPLKTVSENKRGLMNARIKGVQTATYDIISFIDDDNWIEKDWVSKVYSTLQKEKSVAACGGYSEPVFEGKSPGWFSEFSIAYAAGKQQNISGFVLPEKGYLWGAGLTVRKAAWNDLFNSGFHSLLKGRSGKSLTAGEDSEFCLALVLRGWKLWYDDSLKLKHYMPQSRLKVEYLIGMYKGFGKAEVVLSLYRSFINKKISNKASWTLQSLASIKKTCLAGLNTLFSSSGNKIRNRVSWNHDKAYLSELIFNRKKYNEAKKQIEKFVDTAAKKNQ